jgi:hypothetical protein
VVLDDLGLLAGLPQPPKPAQADRTDLQAAATSRWQPADD